ncbi:hypothetical protein ACEPAF_341 [Sanghuangporus sanghuang]
MHVGQRTSGGVCIPYQVCGIVCATIKQMDPAKQPKKDLTINAILVMCSSRYPVIIIYIDNFLQMNELRRYEYMECGSLTNVVTACLITDAEIIAVSKEMCHGAPPSS